MRYLTVLLAFYFFSQLINAQTGTITGTITDSISGDPLIGVNVVIEKTKIGASSDQKGYFEIRNLKPATYKLVVTHIGYQSKIVENIKVNPYKTTKISIKLSAENVIMDEMSVMAEKPLLQRSISNSLVKTQAGVLNGRYNPNFNTEEYAYIEENGYRDVGKSPLSTFFD